jgi:hypothetical protein
MSRGDSDMKRFAVLTFFLLAAGLNPLCCVAGGSCGGGWHGGGWGWYGGGCGPSFSFGIGFGGYYPAGGWGYGYPSFAVSYAPVIYPSPTCAYAVPQATRTVTSVTVAPNPVIRTTTQTVISRTSVPTPSGTALAQRSEPVGTTLSQISAYAVPPKGTWVLDPQPYRYVPSHSAKPQAYPVAEYPATVASSPALPR